MFAKLFFGKRITMPHIKYPKEVILKDHREATLRITAPEDHQKLIRFYQHTEISFRWYLKEDPCDPEVIFKWIANQKDGKAFSIVAESEDQIVAHASLLLRPYGSRKHVARLRIMVSPDYRNKQLGTWMLFDLIKRAMEMEIERVRMDFVVGVDDAAIEAVRKLDFVQEGLLRDYIKDENGKYHDYLIMIKQLHKEWSDF